MWAAITALIPLVVKLISSFLDYKQSSQASREAFLRFVRSMEQDEIISVKQRKSYDERLRRLLDGN